MKAKILFRDIERSGEEVFIKKYFDTIALTDVKPGDLVIGRYSVLPFYQEVENSIKALGGKLINTYSQHRYVADLKNYYQDLKEFTPETWFDLTNLPDDLSFVLKGETNSKKFFWKTHMFAKDKKAAVDVYCRLQEDSMISQQEICIRKYIPLKTFFVSIKDLPITNEFRIFVCYGKIMSMGYYWSNYYDEIDPRPDAKQVPLDFVQKIIDKIGDKCNFYCIDVAETQDGEWILIELNDAQMSGTSCNDLDILYESLKNEIHTF